MKSAAEERLGLTTIQAAVLEFLRLYIGKHGYPPSHIEICAAFEWSSANASSGHLNALQRKGAISITPGVSRGLRVLV